MGINILLTSFLILCLSWTHSSSVSLNHQANIFWRNPNQPERLPWGVPIWPQYSKDDNVFLQLAASNTRLIRTPNKRQLDDVHKTLLSATRRQYVAENQQCTAWFFLNIDKTCWTIVCRNCYSFTESNAKSSKISMYASHSAAKIQ